MTTLGPLGAIFGGGSGLSFRGGVTPCVHEGLQKHNFMALKAPFLNRKKCDTKRYPLAVFIVHSVFTFTVG